MECLQGTDCRLPVFVSWIHYTNVAIFKARSDKILRISPPPLFFEERTLRQMFNYGDSIWKCLIHYYFWLIPQKDSSCSVDKQSNCPCTIYLMIFHEKCHKVEFKLKYRNSEGRLANTMLYRVESHNRLCQVLFSIQLKWVWVNSGAEMLQRCTHFNGADCCESLKVQAADKQLWSHQKGCN